MIFGETPTNTPKAYDQEIGTSSVQDFGFPKATLDLLAAIAGSSPYLARLIVKERAFLEAHLGNAPELALEQAMMLEGDIDAALRQAKRRVALVLALCDLTGIRDLDWVTTNLTKFADFAVNHALRHTLASVAEKLPVKDPFGGVFCLAMGKMGACELNYSSDIDLIFFFDDSRYASEDIPEMRSRFVKAVQKLAALLGSQTADGYVFRIDLRLRPNPAVTPVCASVASATNYYLDHGRTWERAAFIKARVCAGDLEAGNMFLDRMQDFVWRSNLDFAALEEIKDQLRLTRNYKGLIGEIDVIGHNLKLGRGGIREIEFFAQSHQLIFGGRHPDLRGRETQKVLEALGVTGLIDPEKVNVLILNYRKLREAEHRIQMLRDAQTHSVPKDEDFERLVHLSGTTAQSYQPALTDILVATEEATHTRPIAPQQMASDTKTNSIFENFKKLPSLKAERAQASLERLEPIILQLAENAPDKEQAIELFGDFLGALPAGVQPLAMLEQNPELLTNVFTLVSRSRSLAFELARYFERLYGQIDPSKTAPQMQLGDIESALISIRKWKNETQFRILRDQLLDTISQDEAEARYTELAEATLRNAVQIAMAETRVKHGQIENSEPAILAMGKLASREMTARSDLDLIVLYSGDPSAESDGKKPVDLRSYYTFFTRRLITAITVEMAGGRLYEVDMRLRPSGRAGTVATSVAGFEEYQMDKAWVWEHLALTRARVVSGNEQLHSQIEDIRKKVIAEKATNPNLIKELKEMRDRIAQLDSDPSNLSVKKPLGGTLDIELFAQAIALQSKNYKNAPRAQLEAAHGSGFMSRDDAETLIQTHQFLSELEHLKRLLGAKEFRSADLTIAGLEFLLIRTGQENLEDLISKTSNLITNARAIIEQTITQMDQN